MGIIMEPTRDQREYLEGIAARNYSPQRPCDDCGAPMGEHMIGGPGPFHPRPLKPATYDSACFDLAEHFLQDEPIAMQTLAHQLATAIQQTIETWCEYERSAHIKTAWEIET